MGIMVEKFRGTKLLNLIHLLEAVRGDTFNSLDSGYKPEKILKQLSIEDISFYNFCSLSTVSDTEITTTILEYLKLDERVDEYFNERTYIISNATAEHGELWSTVRRDRNSLKRWAEKYFKYLNKEQEFKSLVRRNNQFVRVYPILLLAAKFQLEDEFNRNLNSSLTEINKTFRERPFQATIINNVINIICSQWNAIINNLHVYRHSELINKINKSKLLTLLVILNSISRDFKVSLKSLTSNKLNMSEEELSALQEALVSLPDVPALIRKIQQRESKMEKDFSPLFYADNYYAARPVDGYALQIELFQAALPKGTNLENMEESGFYTLLHQMFKRKYELL